MAFFKASKAFLDQRSRSRKANVVQGKNKNAIENIKIPEPRCIIFSVEQEL